ncbi:MalY/PatB family protein [Brachybacterium sp. GCM10030268]|uniref:MalY/PatB family protein n=1 Tax=Brachybacterium sp. GCM10030268 TaxID=3273382 RepID=UPI00361AF03E
MPTTEQLDAITYEDLTATGATKWVRGDGVIGAFVAEMDYGVAQPITDRLHREVDRGAFGYLPGDLKAEMQAATAEFVRRHAGWEVPPEDIHEMPDVITVYQAAIDSFTSPDSKIIVPTPAYMPFLLLPPLIGREVIEVEMALDAETNQYRYDLEALEAAFDAGGELLVLCNPGNPTGRVLTREELEQIAELVDRKGGRVFSDEIWMPLVLSGSHISYASLSETTANHTITAVAASKAFNLPGLKCAQMITSNDADRKHWRAVGHFVEHGAANLGLAATSAAYTEGEDWLGDIVEYLRRNRDELSALVAELLPRASVTTMEGTYVAWLDLRAYDVDGSLHSYLLEAITRIARALDPS